MAQGVSPAASDIAARQYVQQWVMKSGKRKSVKRRAEELLQRLAPRQQKQAARAETELPTGIHPRWSQA
jgi:hypothetical protein